MIRLLEELEKLGNLKRIALVRDTSGSMFTPDTNQIQKDFADKIAKTAEVFIIDADSEVRQTFKYEGEFKQLAGGGGTCYKDTFKVANELEVDALIYFTDCSVGGDYPNKEEVGKLYDKTIWLTFDQDEVDVPFGKHVNIPENEKQYLVMTDDMGGDYTIYVVPQYIWDKIKSFPSEPPADVSDNEWLCRYCEFVLGLLLNEGGSLYRNRSSQTYVVETCNMPETHGFVMIPTF